MLLLYVLKKSADVLVRELDLVVLFVQKLLEPGKQERSTTNLGGCRSKLDVLFHKFGESGVVQMSRVTRIVLSYRVVH